jgi:hypothetical protein
MEVSPGCAVVISWPQVELLHPPSFYDAWKSWFNVKTSWRCVE